STLFPTRRDGGLAAVEEGQQVGPGAEAHHRRLPGVVGRHRVVQLRQLAEVVARLADVPREEALAVRRVALELERPRGPQVDKPPLLDRDRFPGSPPLNPPPPRGTRPFSMAVSVAAAVWRVGS